MLTITCPFAGKSFCLERVLASMKRLQIPCWPVKWVFFDNSGDPIFTQRLRQFLYEVQGRVSDNSVITHIQVSPKTKYNLNTIFKLYNDLKSHVIGNWLSLEDDVCDYPVDLISRFYRELYSSYSLAIIGAHIETRRGYPGPLTWRVENIPGQGIGLRPVEPRSSGLTIVDAIHTGCTLIRPSAYSNYTFKQEGTNQKILGHDIHLCVDSREKGLQTGILWGTRAGHMTEEGVKYPMGEPNFINNVEAKTANPLISVVTPTVGRPKLLSRLIQQLKDQTYPYYEHLICNDGQSQQIAKIAEIEGGTKTRYYELGFKHGFSGAPQRNLMINKAGGELIVFVDDDAQIKPLYLRTMVNMWRAGHMIGFAQIELEDPKEKQIQIIPESKEMVTQVGHVDTLCGFVDSGIAKGFFWDLFDEHDFRYFQQILSYTKGAYGWTSTIVAKNSRSFSRSEKEPAEINAPELVLELSRSYKTPTPEAEALILTNPQATLQYIVNALKSERWEPGEAILATNPNTALFYITNILRGSRFSLAENLLSKDSNLALAYTRATKLRWKDLGRSDVEDLILGNEHTSSEYKTILGME